MQGEKLNPIADIRKAFDLLLKNVPQFNPLATRIQVGRSIIAIAELLTLSLTSWSSLTADVLGRVPTVYCAGPRVISVFCLGGSSPTEIGRWLGIGISVLVVAGLLPRYVAFLHVWLALSMSASLSLPDGGESVGNFATLFIVVIVFADRRVLAWWPADRGPSARLTAVAYAASIGLCIQIAGLYYESGLSKIAVSEWADGSAMYFIVRDPYFGASGPVLSFLGWLTNMPLGSAALTWGTIVLETLIATLFLLPAKWKRYALVLVILLHGGIAITLGLWSFSLTMIGTAVVAAYTLRPQPVDTGDARARTAQPTLTTVGGS